MTSSWMSDLREKAAANPSAVAITESRGRSISRGALVATVEALVASLVERGFMAGDGVLFSVRPGIDAVALVFAVHDLGGVLLPMDPGVCDALFDARMALLKPRWVFAQGVLLSPSHGVFMRLLRARGMQFAPLGAVPGARYIHVGMRLPGGPSSTAFRSLLHRVRREANGDAAMKPPAVEHDEELPSFVVCTSGTTADPKAVVHTRRSLRAIVAAIGDQLALGEGDVMYARDLHLLLPALFAGARIVIPRERSFDAHVALRTLASEGVTHAFLVTRDCRLVLDACLASAQRVPDTLRSLLIGAAPVRTPFLARFREVLPAHTVAWCVYGATEVLPVSRVSLEDKLAYAGEGDLVGTVMSGVSVRTDEHGELWVKGDRLFTGYAGSAPVAEHATGDLARIEDDRIVLLGRAKDMIIRGEHNIYPALYEPLVERVPGVRRAAMVGDYDSVLADERVILVVEPEQGVDEHDLVNRVWRAVRGGPLRLDSSAQPDRIIVRALPETGRSHKVDKNALRRQLGAALP